MAYLYPMKKIVFGLLCLFIVKVTSAQETPLEYDESNKYVYYKVEEMPGITADTLYQRGWDFAKALNTKNKPAKGKATYAVNTKGSFPVYTGSSLVKKEAGAVTYTLNIEAKEQKFRYKLSDFVFLPYKRDRFNNMTAQPGIDVPAEKLLSKYSAKETDEILAKIAAFCQSTGASLRKKMEKVAVLRKPQPVKKITTDNW
jgi:hypothetical protein